MMKKLFALSVILIAFTAAAFSQSSASASAAATIIAPISIEKASGGDMDFGTIASSSSTGGTCILDTDNNRTASPGITLMNGTPPQAARFIITGVEDADYDIDLPDSNSPTIVSDGNSNYMEIDNWVSNYTGKITNGSVELRIGATLTIAANQPAGVYSTNNSGGSGDFIVTVNYQ